MNQEQLNVAVSRLRYEIERCVDNQTPASEVVGSCRKRTFESRNEDLQNYMHLIEGQEKNKFVSERDISLEAHKKEIADLKTTVDKLLQRLKSKDTVIKGISDDLSSEKAKNVELAAESKRVLSEGVARDRFLKSIQTEFEILRNLSKKSHETIASGESEGLKMKQEIEKLVNLARAQKEDIETARASEARESRKISSMSAELVALRATNSNLRATMAESSIRSQSSSERYLRLETRCSALREELDRERQASASQSALVASLEKAVAEAKRALIATSNSHAVLIKK
jgi:chromosome segregation ATPase